MATRAQKRVERLKKLNLIKESIIQDKYDTSATIEDYYNLKISDKEVRQLSQDYYEEILRVEEEFKETTKLSSLDLKFLFFATALQCVRQYVFSNEKFRFNEASEGDNFMKPIKSKARDFHEILAYGVPYDAVARTEDLLNLGVNTGLSGSNHRYRTLGHDPLLGWIFGTMNIVTSTLTKNDIPLLTSYNVVYSDGMKSPKIAAPTNIFSVFDNTISNIKEDPKVLPAALIKQGIHYGSDAFTKMGLPVPILNTIAPDLNSRLLSENFRIDAYSVARGAALSILINSIICGIHGLFYDPAEWDSRDLYEVKTRKILMYSNLLASSSNVLYVALSGDGRKIDIGGMLVTIYRLISDTKFISEVQKEFINSKLTEKLDTELRECEERVGKLLKMNKG